MDGKRNRRRNEKQQEKVVSPPQKLIKFLQKNSDSLKYFQYLQSQLDNDVRLYKKRAERYKKRVSELELQIREGRSAGQFQKKESWQKKKDNREEIEVDSNASDDSSQLSINEEDFTEKTNFDAKNSTSTSSNLKKRSRSSGLSSYNEDRADPPPGIKESSPKSDVLEKDINPSSNSDLCESARIWNQKGGVGKSRAVTEEKSTSATLKKMKNQSSKRKSRSHLFESKPECLDEGMDTKQSYSIEVTSALKALVEDGASLIRRKFGLDMESRQIIAQLRKELKNLSYEDTKLSDNLQLLTRILLMTDNTEATDTIVNTIVYEISSGAWHTPLTVLERWYWATIVRKIFVFRNELQNLVELIFIYLSADVDDLSCVLLDGLIGDFDLPLYLKKHNLMTMYSVFEKIIHYKICNHESAQDEDESAKRLMSLIKAAPQTSSPRTTDEFKSDLSKSIHHMLHLNENIDSHDNMVSMKIIFCNSSVDFLFETVKIYKAAFKPALSAYKQRMTSDDDLTFDERLTKTLRDNFNITTDFVMAAIELSDADIAGKAISKLPRGSFTISSFSMITAHVINLERRTDRYRKIMKRIMNAGILYHLACGKFSETDLQCVLSHSKLEDNASTSSFCHAYDANKSISFSIVEQMWDPHRISIYDKLAPKQSKLVCLTNSERACAMSHVSSWLQCARYLGSVSLYFLINFYEIINLYKHWYVQRKKKVFTTFT